MKHISKTMLLFGALAMLVSTVSLQGVPMQYLIWFKDDQSGERDFLRFEWGQKVTVGRVKERLREKSFDGLTKIFFRKRELRDSEVFPLRGVVQGGVASLTISQELDPRVRAIRFHERELDFSEHVYEIWKGRESRLALKERTKKYEEEVREKAEKFRRQVDTHKSELDRLKRELREHSTPPVGAPPSQVQSEGAAAGASEMETSRLIRVKQLAEQVTQAKAEAEEAARAGEIDLAFEKAYEALGRVGEIAGISAASRSAEIAEMAEVARVDVEEAFRIAKEAEGEVHQPPTRLKKTFPSKMQARIGVGVVGTTAAALAAAGALYTGLKWYQRKSIRRVIKNHDLNLTDFSPTQKDAMAAAFRASYRVPGAIKRLGMLAKKDQFVSHKVPADTMWSILAEIYYKKSPTPQEVQNFKERVG